MGHPVVEGLIYAAAVGFVGTSTKWLWVQFVLPRWRAAQVQSRDLNNTNWNIIRDGKIVGTCHLKQAGERISGKVDYGETGERRFKYFGIIRSDMIRMEWAEDGLASLNFGSLNLKVSSDSKVLRGYTTFVHRDEGKVVSKFCEYIRV